MYFPPLVSTCFFIKFQSCISALLISDTFSSSFQSSFRFHLYVLIHCDPFMFTKINDGNNVTSAPGCASSTNPNLSAHPHQKYLMSGGNFSSWFLRLSVCALQKKMCIFSWRLQVSDDVLRSLNVMTYGRRGVKRDTATG